jgi:subtilisin family serine protease
MKKILFFYPVILILFSLVNAQNIIQKGGVLYLSNTVVVKLKQNYSINAITTNKYSAKISVSESSQMFPSKGILNKGEEALSRIYILKYNTSEDPLKASKLISKQPGVEWAEPKYVRAITAFNPNDSLYNRQTNLKRIDASDAWQVSAGDSSVHIAIVDIGVDWHHPDLSGNILKNPSGQLIGYDFGGLNGTPDNDPSEDSTVFHGTHVAGIAAAVTNNKIGIASIGNKCKIIPIKASRYDQHSAQGIPYVVYGFEGIKLAVDMGAKVVNCSWGGNSYSYAEQATIDYAVSKGTLVVASQGNDGKAIPFYPADYNGVLSVGWLHTKDDQKSSAGNYGTMVKVYAPGDTILSTWPTKSGFLYTNALSGSSMSAPLVSGLAGLVFSKYPNYTPLQVSEQIRVTADNIDSSNPDSLKYLLGRGRINAYTALTNTNAVSVRATTVNFIDEGNGNGLLESGETVSIQISFTNYLRSVQNVSVDISSFDGSVSLTNTHFDIGSMSTNDMADNSVNKFRFTIAPNAPVDHDVNFLLKFSGTEYSNDFQWITAHINPTYGIHDVGDINVTVTSKGALGFSDYPNNSEGTGFLFRNGENLMFEGALMYGISSNQIMNVARQIDYQSADFIAKIPVKVTTIGTDQVGYAVFSDAGAGSNALGIETHMTSYSYSKPPNNGFIILNTSFHNATSNDITGLYAGYYIDWDIPGSDYSHDTTYFDTRNNFAVAVNNNITNSSVYQKVFTGTALISANANSYIYYGINNSSLTDSVVLSDANGFSDSEKWFTLSRGDKTKTAGGDISLVVSGGPFIVHAKDSINVAYAIAAAATIDSLRTAIVQSKAKYLSITGINAGQNILPDNFALFQNYPNPFNPSTIISYQLSAASIVQIKIYDVLGREVAALINEQKPVGKYNIVWNGNDYKGNKVSSGVYMYRIQTFPLTSNSKSFTATKKMVLIK